MTASDPHRPAQEPPDSDPVKPAQRNTLWRWARVLLVLALIGWGLTQVDPSQLARYLGRDQLLAALLVQPIVALVFAINAVRLCVLCDLGPAGLVPAAKAGVLSIGLNVMIPGRLSELIKVSYLAERAGVPAARALAALLVERSTDLLLVGLIGVASIGFAASGTVPWIAPAMMTIGVTILGAVLIARKPVLALLRRLPPGRLVSAARAAMLQIDVVGSPRKLLVAFLLGSLTWAGSIVSVIVFLTIGGASPIAAGTALLVFLATTIGGAIPALPGGFGAYEAAAAYVLVRNGLTLEHAIGLALALHLSQIVFSVVAALLIVLIEGTGVRSLVRKVLR